ncbi:protein phosphatase, partial [Nannochloropsis gaditana CCMP526]|uniref:protein phosphatase n=1 Tax=Nannochloropsis gaditana (strain CCMP526) TaxID=1093141 RepID=UPI00029F79BC
PDPVAGENQERAFLGCTVLHDGGGCVGYPDNVVLHPMVSEAPRHGQDAQDAAPQDKAPGGLDSSLLPLVLCLVVVCQAHTLPLVTEHGPAVPYVGSVYLSDGLPRPLTLALPPGLDQARYGGRPGT